MEELQMILSEMRNMVKRLERLCVEKPIGNEASERNEATERNDENQKKDLQSDKSKPLKDLEIEASDFLAEFGVPAHLKGYRYLRQAIVMSVENPGMVDNITKMLYPDIAKNNGDTVSRVERAIRHALGVSWERGNMNMIEKMFGYTVDSRKGKPANSEFIAMIADRIRLERKAG